MLVVDVAEFYSDQGGGVKTYINQKLQLAPQFGHEVVVIAPGSETRLEKRHGGYVQWIECPNDIFDHRYRYFRRSQPVHQVLDELKPDVLEGSSVWTGGWVAARWPGKAYKSLIFHQDPVSVYAKGFLGGVLGDAAIDRLCFPMWKWMSSLSRRYDVTITAGQWLADRLSSFHFHHPRAIPFGINKAQFSALRRSEETRAELLSRCGLSPEATLCLAVSRFHPEKRLPCVIEGFGRAKKEREMGLVIVGDGLARKSVLRAASRVANIHFAGTTSDMELLASWYASADIFLHGSGSETFGLVIAEALCSGLPIVVPDSGGAADHARPGYAQTYTAGDAKDCANAIAELLARDRRELSAAAVRDGCSSVRDIEEHFEALFSFYAEEVGKRG